MAKVCRIFCNRVAKGLGYFAPKNKYYEKWNHRIGLCLLLAALTCQRGKVKSDPISNNDEVFVHFTETGILLISSNLNQFKGSFAAFIRLEIRASC